MSKPIVVRSDDTDDTDDLPFNPLGDNSGAVLQRLIARIEDLETEKAETQAVIRSIYTEAKGTGFDPPTIRAIIRLRKLDAKTRAERELLLDTYLVALEGSAFPS